MEARNSSSANNELEPKFRVDGSCWKFIPVISEGLFSRTSHDDILRHPLTLLQLQLAIVFILASSIHFCFFKRFKLPRLISEVLTGMILGETGLGTFFPEICGALFSKNAGKIMYTLTRFGYFLFMFLIGVKMDVSLVAKSRRREWTMGAIIIIFPMLVIVSMSKHIALKNDRLDSSNLEGVGLIGGTLMLTSFPVVACFLMDQKIINSEMGHLALSVSLISDLLSIVIINLNSYGVLIKFATLRASFKSMFLSIAVVVFIISFLRPMMFWMIRQTPEGKPVKDSYIYIFLISLLLVGIVGDNVGLQYYYGPFFLGLAVPTGPPLATTLVEKLDTMVTGWMLPLMSTYCGFKSNLWELNRRPLLSTIFVLTAGTVMKFSCGFIPAILFKMPWKDAAVLSLILNSQGIIGLGTIATNVEKMPVVSQEFTLVVLVVLFYAAVVPILIRSLYDSSKTYTGYQKRTIFNSSAQEGIRVLACAHRQDDAMSAIRLLELMNPAKASPLSVHGLYLEELLGGSTPLLLNHQLGQKSSEDGSRWQPIVDVFNFFKSQNIKQTQVQVFTAITPPKLMHEDICWIAFSHLVALLILPFHRKWNSNGNLISDSKELRVLNIKVLNKAPCSLAIWIDRSKIRGPSFLAKSPEYNICVVYLGGKDDREALAIARRMRGWISIHLTVVRFISIDVCPMQGWESMLDDECLRDIKHQSPMNTNVVYREQRVKDGADTSMVVLSLLEENFDLILVGRHAVTKSPIIEGLSDWAEFPELGPIGDQLASAEVNKTVSVLVVQQQVIENE
ncbi:Cation/H+ exchanger [Corchorus olitorius]|uniref:Cation/H+ exchanger n=1 Tax=Corchorus olitorius TaxID=93759 RepID=A0A1R3HZV1_9ROSI|nr:Cation/H+ exchanger [Corchorus olitorius]